MIIITGAAGFIGSCIASKLNQSEKKNLILVDSLEKTEKWKNLRHLDFSDYLDRSQLISYLSKFPKVNTIIHMGACSSTTEHDADYLIENNYRYTLNLARYCMETQTRFIYASSAATYGLGEFGYDDNEKEIHRLRPLNMYGYSKQLFDLKARREGWLKKIVGIKFFNVYGPNEYFKEEMASVIFKAFNQINQSGKVRLFKSYHPDYEDGQQLRDFIYVKDAVEMVIHFMENENLCGLYNAGTGKARSFKDLVTAVFRAMNLEPNIEYIEMPEDIRGRYQYFTEAKMDKLFGTSYKKTPFTLEDGITDYVQNYLMKDFAHY